MFVFFNIKNIFMTIVYWIKLLKNFFNYKNYDVISASIEYNISDNKERSLQHIFWKKEMKYWSLFSNNYWVDITSYFRPKLYENLIKKMPSNIDDYTLYVKYFYNGKKYKYISRNKTTYDWPPTYSSTIKFSLPIFSSYILNENGERIKNVTKKVKKCAGPKNDFHNQKIKARDISGCEFDSLEITDIVKNRKVIKYEEFIN